MFVEDVVENEISLRSMLLDELPDAAVEMFQDISVRAPPGLVDWSEAQKRWVATPALQHGLGLIVGPLQVFVVDFGVPSI